MPINPSIALSVKPVEFQDPTVAYGRIAAIQQAQQQNALAQMQMAEYARARQEEEGVRNYLAGKDISAPGTQAGLYQYGKTGVEYATKLQAAQKARMEQQSAELKLAGDRAEQAGRIYGTVTDQASWDRAKPKLAALGGDPTKLPEQFDPAFIKSEIQSALSVKDRLEQHFVNQDVGASTRVLTMPKYGGGPAAVVSGSDVAKTLPPQPPVKPELREMDNGVEKWTVQIDPVTKTSTEIPGTRQKIQITPFQREQINHWKEQLKKQGTELSPDQSALVSKAILEGRLDPNRVNSKNAKIIASTLAARPDADLRNLALEATTETASARTLGTISANVVTAAAEAEKMIPIAQGYIAKIQPSDYPIANKAGLYVAKNTGDPNQAGLAASLNALVNTYARAINPRGVPTVSDKNHAREVINAAMSQGQFAEVFNVMQQEMQASQAAPKEARGKLFPSKSGAAATGAARPSLDEIFK